MFCNKKTLDGVNKKNKKTWMGLIYKDTRLLRANEKMFHQVCDYSFNEFMRGSIISQDSLFK